MSFISYTKPAEDGTDRIRLLKTASIIDPKTKMELLKVRIGFTLPYENELSTLDEQLEWLRKEYLVSFVADEGIDFKEVSLLLDWLNLKSKNVSLNEVEMSEFNVIKHYVSSQVSLEYDFENMKMKILGIITTSFKLRGRPLKMNEYMPLFNEFSTTLNNEILETNEFRECLVVRVGLANRVRHCMACKKPRRPLPKIDLVVNSKIEPEPTPEPTPEPPKVKEAKPSKQSQTRSANKARDQKKREQEEYLRRVAEAEKARAEEEERKRRAKKASKKI